VYHWVDRRIRAHIFICVMALQIQRLIRSRLRKAGIARTPERALEKLSIQRALEVYTEAGVVQGLVKATAEQLSLFKAMDVPPPQHKHLQQQTL